MDGQMLYAKKENLSKMRKANYVKDNEYYTPKSVLNYFERIDNIKFDYDPATCIDKANEFDILNYDTIETNGLNSDWTKYKKIWINPPFTNKQSFIKKAVETYKKIENDIYIYILIPIEFLTTKRFTDALENVSCKIFIPNGRINFESGLGKKGKSPAFGSVIIKLQDKWEIELIDIKNLK